MENRVLVCGLGHVGYRIALLLRRLGVEVTAIYENTPADWVQRATQLGIVCLAGDARDDALLEKAGIRTARAIIAATDNDMVNLSVAMDARRINSAIVIITRLFDTSLAPHIEKALDLRKALSASSLAAPVFASAALGHNIACTLTVGAHAYTISELTVAPDSAWLGLRWEDVSQQAQLFPLFQLEDAAPAAPLQAGELVQAGQTIMVLRRAGRDFAVHAPETRPAPRPSRRNRLWQSLRKGWKDVPLAIQGVMAALLLVITAGTITFHLVLQLSPVDAFYFVITTITTTGYGDYNLQGSAVWLKLFGCFIMLCGAALMATVFSVVTDILLKSRFRHLMDSPAEAAGPHAILVGANHISQRIAQELRHADLPVVTLAPLARDRSDLPGVDAEPVIIADPRDDAALTRAGIATATAIVAVTEDDVLNLSVVLQARKMNPAVRTVIRTFDADLGAKLQAQLGSDAVISTSAVSAPVFVAAALYQHVIQATVWRNHLLLAQFGEAAAPADQAACSIAFAIPAQAAEKLSLLRTPHDTTRGTSGTLRIRAIRLT